MEPLNRATAAELGAAVRQLPVKVLQFGEGNFLRAFIDWMIQGMNDQGLFNGGVTVAQPIEHGMVQTLNEQDGLYTLLLRGIRNGEVVVDTSVIQSITRTVNLYTRFDDYLREAENPRLRVIVSNTTEAGIEFRRSDRPTDAPPTSFPGKLLRFLKYRFDVFNGDAAKGFLLFPCELIDRNGDTLKQIVTELARQWYPDDTAFQTWLIQANVFFNTLVDRIVSGYPRDEAEALCHHFGYRDKLIVAGEIFHFLVVEGPLEYEPEFPLVTAGFNVKWCGDMTPYRTRKVRILNGAHTMTVLAAHLYGLETVKNCMDDPVLAKYARQGVFEEIIPTLDLPRKELEEFGEAVLERFSNPYINHLLLSISLNSVSKFTTRVLPSLLEYQKRKGTLPRLLTFSLAALILFYRGIRRGDIAIIAERQVDGEPYEVKDSPDILDFFWTLWNSESDLGERVQTVLSRDDYWGMDLNTVPGLTSAVAAYLEQMIRDGVPAAVRRVTE
ncbi:MAG: tagaturonate reductase [Lentisphaeria bacterium]|nr:tagaturonate reductase [Lentisphaeria bacterium]